MSHRDRLKMCIFQKSSNYHYNISDFCILNIYDYNFHGLTFSNLPENMDKPDKGRIKIY